MFENCSSQVEQIRMLLMSLNAVHDFISFLVVDGNLFVSISSPQLPSLVVLGSFLMALHLHRPWQLMRSTKITIWFHGETYLRITYDPQTHLAEYFVLATQRAIFQWLFQLTNWCSRWDTESVVLSHASMVVESFLSPILLIVDVTID